MRGRMSLTMIMTLICLGAGRSEAQATTNAAGGGGGGLCDERCVYVSTPVASGWACRYSPGLGEGWSCSATTDICTILLPSNGCPFAMLESSIRFGEQFVQLCRPVSVEPVSI